MTSSTRTFPPGRSLAGALAILASLALCCPRALHADGLKSAQVSRIFNEVKLLPENEPARAAALADVVTGKAAVQTGAASRTELTFSDKTLTRLGASSFFSFVNGTRDMNLNSGTMLLQVPKDAGGATIHTAAVTAAITGTTLMVEYNPKSYSKIVVLEGTVRVYLTGHVGESILVHAGEVVIVPPNAVRLPDPSGVDLKVIYATSGLINDFGALPSKKLIAREIDAQKREFDSGLLQSANQFIVGAGTSVQSGSLSFVSGSERRITARETSHRALNLGTNSASTTTPTATPPPATPPATTPPATTPPATTPPATTPPATTPPATTPPATTPPATTPPATTPPATTPPATTPPATTPPATTPPATTPPATTPPATTPPATTPPATTPPATTPPATTPPATTPPATTPPATTPPATTPPATTPPAPTPASKTGPLPVIAGNDLHQGVFYDLNATSAIRTDPFITTNGVQDSGRIYRGVSAPGPLSTPSPDGAASSYFLGAANGPSGFDATVGFNDRFGNIGEVGGFEFTSLALLGSPASLSITNGPTNLAFIATNQITDAVPGTATGASNVFDLAALDHVLFATQDGSITFNTGLTFGNSGTTVPALTLYARGGALDLAATTTFNLPGSSLFLYGEGGITENAVFTAIGNVRMISGAALAIGHDVTAAGGFFAETTTSTNSTDPGGDLTLAAGQTIRASSVYLSASGTLSIAGTVISTDANGAPDSDVHLVSNTSLDLTSATVVTARSLLLTAFDGGMNVDGSRLTFTGGNGGLSATVYGGSLTLNNLQSPNGAEPLFITGISDGGITTNTGLTTAAASNDGTQMGTGILLNATGGDVTINGPLQSRAGSIYVAAGAGTLTLGGTVNSAGTVYLSSSGALSIGSQVQSVGPATFDSTANAVTLQNVNVHTTGAPTSVATSDVALTGGTSVSIINSLVSSSGALTLTANNGSVMVDGNSNLAFPGSAGGLTANAHGGSLTINSGTDGYGGNASNGGFYPLFVTGTADTGITINGTLETAATSNGTGISLTATSGDVDTSATIVSGAGDIALTATTGAMTLSGTVQSAGGLTLSSVGAMHLYTNPTNSVGPATLTSSGDAVTLQNLNFYTTGAPTTAGASDVTLTGGTSVSIINSLVSSSGALTLKANNGSVLVDGNSNLAFPGSAGGFTANAHGGSLTINAGTDGYGSTPADYPLFVTGTADTGITINGTLESAATSNGSGIHLTANGGDVNTSATIVSGAGDIALTATTGAMTLSGTVQSAGGLTLSSAGAMHLYTNPTNSVGSATLTSSGDAVTLQNLNFYTMGAASDVALTGGTSVSIINSLVSSSGALTLTANNGNVLVDGNSNLTFPGSDGGLTATAHGGSIAIQPGTDGTGGFYPLFVMGTADKGITINGDLESAATSVDGTRIGTGIHLTASGGDITANAGIDSLAGNVVIAANAGMISLNGNVTSAGSLSLSSSAPLTIYSQLQSVGPGTLASTTGGLTLQNLNFHTTGAPTTAGASDVILTGGTSVSIINSLVSSSGALTLTANNGSVLVDGNSNLAFPGSNGGFTANAHGGSLTINSGTDGYGSNASNGGFYPLFVTGTADTGITINGTLESAATSKGTGISLTATSGDIDTSATIVSGAGNVTLTATTGAMTLSGTVQSAGTLTLGSTGAMHLYTNPTNSVGSATLTSSGDAVTLQNLNFHTTGAPTGTTTSNITLDGNTAVNIINSLVSSSGGLTLTAAKGSVMVDGNSNLAFPGSAGGFTANAHGGSLTISAGTDGYGSTPADYPLFVTGTADSGITINGTLESAATSNGSGIHLTANGGDINTSATIVSGAGDIALTATTGAMTLSGTVQSAGGLTLSSVGMMHLYTNPTNSVGSATLTSSGDAVTLQNLNFYTTGAPTTAGTSDITLNGATGVNIVNSLVSSSGGLTLTAAKGSVLVDGNSNLAFPGSAGGLTAAAHGGSLTISAGTDGYGSTPADYPLFVTGTADTGITINGTLESAATSNGSGIHLTANGGDINTSATIVSGAGDIALTATTGAMTLSGTVQSAGGLTLSSVGMMHLYTNPTNSVGAATLTSSGDAVTLQNLNFYTTGAPTTAGTSDITLNGNTAVNIVNSLVSSSGGLTLTAAKGSVLVDGNSNLAFPGSAGGFTANAHGGSLTISAGTDGYGSTPADYPLFVTGTADSGITINGTLESAATSKGTGISLTATSGDITTSATIVSGAGNIVLTTQGGAMTLSGTVQSAGTLTLGSTGAMQLYTNPTNSVGSATLTSSGDAVTLQNLNFHTTGAPTGTTTSNITLDGNTAVNIINSAVSSNGNMTFKASDGNVSADGNSSLQFPGSNGGLTLTATKGSITLSASTPGAGYYPLFVSDTADTGILVNATVETASASSDGVRSGGNISLMTTGGNISTNGSVSFVSPAGSVTLISKTGAISLSGEVSSALATTLSSAGTMSLNNFPITSRLLLKATSTAGALSFGDNTFTAPSINFSGDTGVTLSGNNIYPTGGLTLTTLAGDISLDGTNTLEFQGSGQGAVNIVAGGGSVTLSPLSVGSGTSSPSGISVTADEAVTVSSTLTTVPSASDTTGAASPISLTAGTTLSVAGHALTTQPSVIGSDVTAGDPGGSVTLRGGSVSFSNGSISAAGGNNQNSGAGGRGGTITIASTATSSTQTSVSITGSTFNAVNGTSGSGMPGVGGTISISSADASAAPAASPSGSAPPSPTPPAIVVDSTTMIVGHDTTITSTNAPTGNGGSITITSARTGGAGISVQDGSSLNALSIATAGTTPAPTPAAIALTTSGSDITVDDSTLTTSGAGGTITLNTGATGGTINVVDDSALATTSSSATPPPAGSTIALTTGGNTAAQTSAINLSNAVLTADVLKIQALGTNGHITIGGSSTLTGNSQLILFAGDSSTHAGGIIEFVSNATLNSNVAGILTATTIQIDGANTVVTVNSPTPLVVNGTILNYSARNGGNGRGNYGSFAGSGAPTPSPVIAGVRTSMAPPAQPSGGSFAPAAGGHTGTKVAGGKAITKVPGGQATFAVAGGQYILTLDKPALNAAGRGKSPVDPAASGALDPISSSGRNKRASDNKQRRTTPEVRSDPPPLPRSLVGLAR